MVGPVGRSARQGLFQQVASGVLGNCSMRCSTSSVPGVVPSRDTSTSLYLSYCTSEPLRLPMNLFEVHYRHLRLWLQASSSTSYAALQSHSLRPWRSDVRETPRTRNEWRLEIFRMIGGPGRTKRMARIVPDNPTAFPPSMEVRCTWAAMYRTYECVGAQGSARDTSNQKWMKTRNLQNDWWARWPGRTRTYDQGIHLTHLFPKGVDYLITRNT